MQPCVLLGELKGSLMWWQCRGVVQPCILLGELKGSLIWWRGAALCSIG